AGAEETPPQTEEWSQDLACGNRSAVGQSEMRALEHPERAGQAHPTFSRLTLYLCRLTSVASSRCSPVCSMMALMLEVFRGGVVFLLLFCSLAMYQRGLAQEQPKVTEQHGAAPSHSASSPASKDAAQSEGQLLTNIRQVTFAGQRA